MVFFSADESVSASTGSGRELWRTDGTPADTVLFADLNPGRGSSNPADLAATDHLLFFTAITPAAGRELWVTDGTSAGTHLVLDINPGPDSASPYNLTPVGPSRIVFAAYDPDHGTELWESDGTPAGTHRLTDVFPGPEPSSPSQIIAMRDLVFFEANDGVHGREPWAIALSTNLCACDWDDSGLLNTADFFAFLTDFFAAAPAADFNNDGFVNSSDFFEFLSCFFAGCES